ncbi:unnamed protein product [Ectocarpus sp. 4 AP-2014]
MASLARLPPNIARLSGIPPAESAATTPRRFDRGFALAGGLFVGGGEGGDVRAGTAMTTPEVLRSTSLRSRSAVRNATSTPQHQAGGGGGGAAAPHVTPARGTPSERRLFSPEDSNRWSGQGGGGGSAARLTPSEVAKAGRRAIAVRPQDVGDLMKVYDERHAKPTPADPASQVYQGDSAQEGLGGREDESYKEYAKQLLVSLGIADKTDDYTKNVKTYVVGLMRTYLRHFEKVCRLLEERGVSREILRQEVHRQPQLRTRSSPRAHVNLSLRDMAQQLSTDRDFYVQGNDGQQTSLFREYQVLEEALHVTAGSGTGVAAGGNPAYVLSRLSVLSEDDFMSAFDYAGGGGYPAGRDWAADLPTDAAIVMKLFVCCSDKLLPRDWEEDRPFARQFFVDRAPSSQDALPGRFFLTRTEVLHPPHFFVVADQAYWHALPGSTNVFQAIALFFHAIKTRKSSYLGPGISVANIVNEMFGAEEEPVASPRGF